MIKIRLTYFFSLHRWNSQMQCAPKLVYPSQDRPVRMAVSQWLTSVQDYPWASAWLISPDHTWVSALQPVKTHSSFPSESTWKCLSSWQITTHQSWSALILNLEFSQSYLSEDSESHSLTSNLERLDRCCPLTTWLSGISKDLPTYGVNHLTISDWSFTNTWKTSTGDSFLNKHASLFSRFFAMEAHLV